MSETKPSYDIDGGTLEAAQLEQLKSIHEEYGRRKKEPGEFTAKEYGALVGCGYAVAFEELKRAIAAGKVKKRKAGNMNFYRLVNHD